MTVSGRINFNAPGVSQLQSTQGAGYPPNGGDPYSPQSRINNADGPAGTGTTQLIDDDDETGATILSQISRFETVEANPNAIKSVHDGIVAVPENVDLARGPVPWPTWFSGTVTWAQLHCRMDWSSEWSEGEAFPNVNLYLTDQGNYTPTGGGEGTPSALQMQIDTVLADAPGLGSQLPSATSAAGLTDVVWDLVPMGGMPLNEVMYYVQYGSGAGSTVCLWFTPNHDPGLVSTSTGLFTVQEAFITYEFEPPPPSAVLFNGLTASLGEVRQAFST